MSKKTSTITATSNQSTCTVGNPLNEEREGRHVPPLRRCRAT